MSSTPSVDTRPRAELATAEWEDRLAGVLLGTALGDALGLPAEGMKAAAIARRFGRLDRFRLLGSTGFVSDDTEQSALVAESLCRHPDDPERCADAFRRALVAWFFRLPWGVGLATVRASLRAAAGIRPSGVPSAGNGAAMRAAVLGVALYDRPDDRRRFGRALAEVTHRDERAIAGALFAADLAAFLISHPDRHDAYLQARQEVAEPALAAALDRAAALAYDCSPTAEAAGILGTSGFVLHTVPFAAFCLLRYGNDPLPALVEAISAGGDTDSFGAILGAWLGAHHGERGLPAGLLDRLHHGPFGPSHLRALARCLAARGEAREVPRYSQPAALARNLALYPVIIGHGLRRLLP
jgi:ADP-ribosylglycohydrolase